VNGHLVSIMRPDLERILREQLPGGVDLRFATSLTHIDNGTDGVRLTLTDGSRLNADLLVGADGVHSTVRRLVFGEERQYFRYLGFHTAAYVFEDPEIHAAVRDRFSLTDTIGRQMGFYGLRDGRVATFAVHRTADPTLPGDAQQALRREYGSLGWIVPRALAQCPPAAEVYYDQVAQIKMPRWSRGRATLVGDACQAVSLLAGQSASLAVAGAYILADQMGPQPLDRGRAGWLRAAVATGGRGEAAGRPQRGTLVPAEVTGAALGAPHRLETRASAVVRPHVAASLAGKPTTIVKELDAIRGRLTM
jgi:2-polyprenyl-6-methoxyphenol hydroxylase-like FAD-dependent oxidoreductase